MAPVRAEKWPRSHRNMMHSKLNSVVSRGYILDCINYNISFNNRELYYETITPFSFVVYGQKSDSALPRDGLFNRVKVW